MTSVAAPLFRHIYAADVSREMLKSVEQKLGRTGISYHILDGFTLAEFADDSLDIVYSHDVFVHFSSLQVYPYFKEIKRVLKPGGLGIISFYSAKTHFPLMRDMSLEYNLKKMYPPHMRVHFITEEVIRLMIEDLGLQIVEINSENYLILCFAK